MISYFSGSKRRSGGTDLINMVFEENTILFIAFHREGEMCSTLFLGETENVIFDFLCLGECETEGQI